MSKTREDWIESIKKIEKREVFSKGFGLFSVMTDFYSAPEDIRNDEDLCFSVLLDSNEFIWNIPKKIKTVSFLEKLIERGYKRSILNAKVWEEKDFPFLKNYLKKFNKEDKPKFDTRFFVNILRNKEMALSFVKEDNYNDTEYLINNYKKDKDIMFAFLDNNPNEIKIVLKSIKNSYLKNSINIFNVLKSSPKNYYFFPEKYQLMEEIIDYILIKDNYLFQYIPKIKKEDKEEVIKLIKKHENIIAENLPEKFKNDQEIAEIMIKRDGNSFKFFNFKNDELLIRLATKTKNCISHIPNNKDYESLIREVILKSNKTENTINFNMGNKYKILLVKDLLPQLVFEDKVYRKTISNFFENYINNNGKEETIYMLEKELLIDCIKIAPDVYEQISVYHRQIIEGEAEVTNAYIESAKLKGKDFRNGISQSLIWRAEEKKITIEKYLLNTYLEKNLKSKEKTKGIKI